MSSLQVTVLSNCCILMIRMLFFDKWTVLTNTVSYENSIGIEHPWNSCETVFMLYLICLYILSEYFLKSCYCWGESTCCFKTFKTHHLASSFFFNKNLHHMFSHLPVWKVSILFCVYECVALASELWQWGILRLKWSDPANSICIFSSSHFISWLLKPPYASLSHLEQRELSSPPLLSLLSSPLSVSFDKQICRQCPRITTSFDSQLTVNSQSQGGLHYINGKLDYFFSLETEGEFKDSGGGVVGLGGIRPSNHVELPNAQGDVWQSGERWSHLICFV